MRKFLKFAGVAIATFIGVWVIIFIVFNFIIGKSEPDAEKRRAPQVKEAVFEAARDTITENSRKAMGALAAYMVVQGFFQLTELGAIAENNRAPSKTAFCDNFRNLYYGRDDSPEKDAPLDMLSKEIADAYAGPPRGNATWKEHATQPVPYSGYLFLDDPYVTDWNKECGLVAYPAEYGVTGRYIFWIGKDPGGRYADPKAGLGQPPTLLAPEDSPLHPKGAVKWKPLTPKTRLW